MILAAVVVDVVGDEVVLAKLKICLTQKLYIIIIFYKCSLMVMTLRVIIYLNI